MVIQILLQSRSSGELGIGTFSLQETGNAKAKLQYPRRFCFNKGIITRHFTPEMFYLMLLGGSAELSKIKKGSAKYESLRTFGLTKWTKFKNTLVLFYVNWNWFDKHEVNKLEMVDISEMFSTLTCFMHHPRPTT